MNLQANSRWVHGIDGDGVPLQLKDVEYSSHGCDLILFVADVILADGKTLLGSPRADDVYGPLLQRVASTETLAVECSDLLPQAW